MHCSRWFRFFGCGSEVLGHSCRQIPRHHRQAQKKALEKFVLEIVSVYKNIIMGNQYRGIWLFVNKNLK